MPRSRPLRTGPSGLIPDSFALDVGCGTGIFTRCLAMRVPFQVIGVEPNDDMRSRAAASSSGFPRMRFERGSAESLPQLSGDVVLITAATAAHWFERPSSDAEVARALHRKGTLALIQTKRRFWDSDFLAAYEGFHEHHVPTYKRGTFPDHRGGYSDANFADELRRQPDFDPASD